MPEKGIVKIFGPCQAPLETSYMLNPMDSFKRAYSSGGFPQTMICAQLFQNTASESGLIQKQTRKKHKGLKLHPIDEEERLLKRNSTRRLFLANDVEVSSSIEEIKREGIRVRRSRLEEDILKLHKRLQEEIDLREAFESALSDTGIAARNLPLKMKDVMAEIASLEVTVLKLEEEILYCQWQLCQERKERIILQSYVNLPEKVDSLDALCPSTSYCEGDSLAFGTMPENIHEDLCITASNLVPDASRRLSFWSNCSEEECTAALISVSDEGEALKYSTHQTKKSRQKQVELGSKSCPITPPQDELPNRSLIFKGLVLHPNKLSEKMLQCMMDIYCHLSDSSSVCTTSSSPTSPFTKVTTSSTASSVSESSSLYTYKENEKASKAEPFLLPSPPAVEMQNRGDILGCESSFDPYRTREKLSWVDIGVYGSAIEIRWISVGQEQLDYAAQALRDYRLLVEQLAKVDILSMAHEEKLAFWINIYNALLMHAYLAYGIPKSELKSFFLMQKASYVAGGHAFSALTIEYLLLKQKAPAHRPQIALLMALHKVKLTMEQTKYAIDYQEPLTVFALSCGSRSSPLVKVYTPENVHQQLKSSVHDYVRASVGIGVRGKLLIPKLLYVYGHDTMDDSSILNWIFQHLPSSQVAVIQESFRQRRHRFLSSRNFSILPFDFRFQYLFLRS